MDHGRFDDLARSVVNEAGTRRAVLRFLAGGAGGALVARLGLSESAEAKAKKKRKQHMPRAKQQPTGELQTEGKRKPKNRDKKPKDKKPPPQPVPDPPCPDGKGLCPDGKTCVFIDDCCPDEKRCADGCISASQCCPDEKQCSDNSCVDAVHDCCPDEKRCGDGTCVSQEHCCPGEKRCDGNCVPREFCCFDDPAPLCKACEVVVCESGALVCQPTVDCGPGRLPNPATCQCDCAEGWIPCGGARCGCYVGLDPNRPDGVCDNGRCCSRDWQGKYVC